ncbi:hypothetical protein TGRUB_432930, partial [Toxoplasma gondii RUB]
MAVPSTSEDPQLKM